MRQLNTGCFRRLHKKSWFMKTQCARVLRLNGQQSRYFQPHLATPVINSNAKFRVFIFRAVKSDRKNTNLQHCGTVLSFSSRYQNICKCHRCQTSIAVWIFVSTLLHATHTRLRTAMFSVCSSSTYRQSSRHGRLG